MKKIIARVQNYRRPDGIADGLVEVTIEWKSIAGASASGKIVAIVQPDDDDIREAVALHLATAFPGLKPRNVAII